MTVREQENQIRFQEYETAIAWDDKGAEIFRKHGERFKITFTDEDMQLLSGTVFTHNHPRGLEFSGDDPRSYGNSFSEQDLRFACYAHLAELRVVTPRLRFSLKPPAFGWDQNFWEKTMAPVYSHHKDDVARHLLAEMKKGRITVEEAEAGYFHEICSRVARSLRLPYLREES